MGLNLHFCRRSYDGQTGMARSTRLILIKNIYTLWGRKHFDLFYSSLWARSTRLVIHRPFIRTDRQTDRRSDIARSTRLVILIRYIYFMGSETLPSALYTLWGRKRFLLSVRFFMGSETLPSNI